MSTTCRQVYGSFFHAKERGIDPVWIDAWNNPENFFYADFQNLPDVQDSATAKQLSNLRLSVLFATWQENALWGSPKKDAVFVDEVCWFSLFSFPGAMILHFVPECAAQCLLCEQFCSWDVTEVEWSSPCTGVSGAPLIEAQTGEILGITSGAMAKGCNAMLPAIYTSVRAYANAGWLDNAQACLLLKLYRAYQATTGGSRCANI